MQFMIEGGPLMWLSSAVAIVVFVLSIRRRSERGWVLALSGAVTCIGLGLMGFSFGYSATFHVAALTLDPGQRMDLLARGLHESTRSTMFAGGLAVVLSLLAIVLSGSSSRDAVTNPKGNAGAA